MPRLPLCSVLLALLPVLPCLAAPACAQRGLQELPAAASAPARELALPAIPADLRQALLLGQHARAAELLQQLAKTRPQSAGCWGWLRARSLAELEGDGPTRALAQIAELQAAAPSGPEAAAWARRSRALEARVLEKLGRRAQASAILAEEAQRLRAPERQDALAQMFRDLAEELAKPPRTGPNPPQPEWARAAELYAEALQLETSPGLRARLLLAQAEAEQGRRAFADAAALYERFAREYAPGTPQAPASAAEALRWLEARLALGRMRIEGADPAGARPVLEDLTRELDELAAGRGALAPLFSAAAQAAAGSGAGASAPNAPNAGSGTPAPAAERARIHGEALYELARAQTDARQGTARAVAALRALIARFPEHALRVQAAFDVATRLEANGELEAALEAFDQFLALPLPAEQHAQQRERVLLLQRRALFQKSAALEALERYEEARAGYAQYVALHASGADWTEAQRALPRCDQLIGSRELGEEHWEAARAAWTSFLERWPLDGSAAGVRLELARTWIEQARALEADEEAAPDAARDAQRLQLLRRGRDELAQLALRIAGTNEASHALYEAGTLCEDELGEVDRAVELYRQCNFGARAGEAAARLELLTQPLLELDTEHVFRTGERPQVLARVRNLQSLRVELYPLDLEAYFRRHRSAQRVEALDLDLVAPAKSFDHAVAPYAPYAPLEQRIELPVDGTGAWAVVVSAGDFRGTALVLQSDLDVLVKSGAHDLLVYAQDMRRDLPLAGVRVLVSLPGARPEDPLLELTTGADGVARSTADELGRSGHIGVFASWQGQVASPGIEVGARTLRAAAPSRAALYSDKTIYQPGEALRWRAIFRPAEGERYVVPARAKAAIELVNPGGDVVAQLETALSSFGTAHGSFELDGDAPKGDWVLRGRLLEREPAEAWTQWSVEVQPYRIPRVELSLEPEREALVRGEPAVLRVAARYAWGQPLADARVRITTPDHRVRELALDAEGHARIEYDTREHDEREILWFEALLAEESLVARASIGLAPAEFEAALELARPSTQVGQGVELVLRTQNLLGKPVAAELQLVAKKQARGAAAARVIGTQVFKTDASGLGRVVLAYDVQGSYLLHVSGQDALGNPVRSAEIALLVTGESGEQELRLSCDDLFLESGENMRLRVHNPTPRKRALVTFEGQGVLGYRLVELPRGWSDLELPAGDELYPNFELALALMDTGKLHQASLAFELERKLEIEITPKTQTLAPGAELELALRATDGSGRGVPAELSVAVVDEGVFALRADALPPLAKLLSSAARRPIEIWTESSCEFHYAGVVSKLASALLAERERAADAKRMEVSSRAAAEELAKLGYLGRDANGPASPGPSGPSGGNAPAESETAAGVGGSGTAFRRAGGGARARVPLGKTRSALEPPRPELSGTAYWIADVVTDADGRATLKFALPDSSARWRVSARGAEAGLRLGEGRAEIVTRTDFALELRAPEALVAGDKATVLVSAFAENAAGARVALQLRLRSAQGESVVALPATLDDKGAVEQLIELPADALGTGTLELELSGTLTPAAAASAPGNGAPGNGAPGSAAPGNRAAGAQRRAIARARVEVEPWGIEVAATRAGTLGTRRELALELPADRRYTDLALTLAIAPEGATRLIDEVLGRGPVWRTQPFGVFDAPEAAARLLAASAGLELGRASRADARTLDVLRAQADTALDRLLRARVKGGGWARAAQLLDAEHQAPADLESTADGLIALCLARRAGLSVQARDVASSAQSLRGLLKDTGRGDELRARALYALALQADADFAALNRLYRDRKGLSSEALAFSALALFEGGRAPMAVEMLDALVAQQQPQPLDAGVKFAGQRRAKRVLPDLEASAFALWALVAIAPERPEIERVATWLDAQAPWGPPRARGWSLFALCQQRARSVPQRSAFELLWSLDGGPEQSVAFPAGAPSRVLALPLPAGATRARLALALRGRGEPHYLARLSGFSDSMPPEHLHGAAIYAPNLLAAGPLLDGREAPVGFSTLVDGSDGWINRVSELPLSERVKLGVSLRFPGDAQGNERYWLELPLPAGLGLVTSELDRLPYRWKREGSRLWLEMTPDQSWSFELALAGRVPGEYRALPPALWDASTGERVALERPIALKVLARGAASRDVYRPTPDELLARARSASARGAGDEAWEALSALLGAHEAQLRDEPLAEAAQLLLPLAAARGDSRRVAHAFELLLERKPDLVLPWTQIDAVGRAYIAIEEHERAAQVFRAAIEEGARRDLVSLSKLRTHGGFASWSRALIEQRRELDDTPATLAAALSLADELLAAAPSAHLDARLVREGRDAATLKLEALLLLQHVLAFAPSDPVAPEAGLALVGAHLALDNPAQVAELSDALAKVWKEPRFVDAFRYSHAVAEWQLGRDVQARELLQQVREASYPDEQGKPQPSPNRDLATFVLAQIHHASQEVAPAEAAYEEVAKQFPEARVALEGLRAQALWLDEVTRARPGQPVRLALHHRNLESAELLVYPVDLVTLCLREGDLTRVSALNLAGVAPALRQEVKLGGRGELRATQTAVELGLEQPGAYLALVRSGEHHASGLVLLSDLQLQVQQDPDGGELRVETLEAGSGKYWKQVEVRVVGGGLASFLYGRSDPRGVFVAGGLGAGATVIARSGAHYAFERELLARGTPRDKGGLKKLEPFEQQNYYKNVFELNESSRSRNRQYLDDQLNRKDEGVCLQDVQRQQTQQQGR